MTFDSSVAGLYWTLCGGGTLVLPEKDEEKDLFRVGELIEKYQISHTLCLPSLYRLMLQFIDASKRGSLQAVIVAGEQCTHDIVIDHHASTQLCRLYNEYGPTEATVWSTVCELSESMFQPISIGRPIGNSTVYILTESGQLCPTGVEGEIYIGGGGVSHGYYNQSITGSEHFVANPVNPDQYPVVFRTGDLGFWNSQDEIQFTGRADRQLKIRGNRIEPAEIESVLLSYPGISEVAVTEKPILANAAPSPSVSLSDEQLVQRLSYMAFEAAEELLGQVEQSTPITADNSNDITLTNASSVNLPGQADKHLSPSASRGIRPMS